MIVQTVIDEHVDAFFGHEQSSHANSATRSSLLIGSYVVTTRNG